MTCKNDPDRTPPPGQVEPLEVVVAVPVPDIVLEIEADEQQRLALRFAFPPLADAAIAPRAALRGGCPQQRA